MQDREGKGGKQGNSPRITAVGSKFPLLLSLLGAQGGMSVVTTAENG
jgi:hypothetical protein